MTIEPAQREHHVAIYNEKAVTIDYVNDRRKEFNVAAMRVNDNLRDGQTGIVVTPKGHHYLVTSCKRTSRLLQPSEVPEQMAKHLPDGIPPTKDLTQ